MKNLASLTVLLTLGFFGMNDANATHIQGMNITVQHIGGDTFVSHCDFFRYCGGTAFNNGNCTGAAGIGTTAYYYIRCEENGVQVSRTAAADTIKEATPICDSLNATQNSCVVGNCGLLGIQWGVYTDTVVLDSATMGAAYNCPQMIFVYASGARNTGVNYVSQPSIVAYTRINFEEAPNNSSVQFNSNKPIPFFCDGQPVTYNWSAYDPNGDSLWWELDTAWNSYASGNFNSITYAGTYSGPQPMPGTTVINNATGQLNFTATIPAGYNFANYAIAVTVKEYDPQTGEYRGEVHRDIQFIVLDSCNNVPPVDTAGIQNFAGSGALIDSTTIVVCTGQDFEFDLLFYDYDTAGNLSNDSILSVCNIDQILPGAVWTTSGTNPDTVHISWTAVPTNQTYVPFNVTVEDDFCPVTGFNVFSYVVRIEPSTFLGSDTAICELDSIILDANGGDTFYWSVLGGGDPIVLGQNFGCAQCATPWVHPAYTTTYVVESNLEEACGNKDTMTVEVFEKFPINLTPDLGGTAAELVYCATDPLDTLISETLGGTYLGSGIVNAVDGVFAPDIVDPGSGRDTAVQIIYLLEGICANTDTINIRVKGAPDASIATVGPYCEQLTSVNLQGNFTIVNTNFQSESWMNADSSNNPSSGGELDPSTIGAPDTIKIYHTVNDSGCVNTDSANVPIVGEYNSRIDSLPRLCEGDSVVLFLNSYEGDPFGTWLGEEVTETPEGSGNFYLITDGLKAGNYDITYKIDGACGTESDTSLVISELPDARFFGADSVYCDNILDSIQLNPIREHGIWGGSLPELQDGYFIPQRVGEGVYTISYELYDTASTCYNKKVLPVRVARTPVPPKVFGGGPYCQGHYLDNVRGDGLLTNTFKWYDWYEYDEAIKEDPDTIPNVKDMNLLGAGNPFAYGELTNMPTRIYGTQMSEYGCESGWRRLDVTVYPSPYADFVSAAKGGGIADSLKAGNIPLELQFINLSNVGADSVNVELTYTWMFGPFGTSDEESPSFVFEQIGQYPVSLVVDNGVCTDSHAVVINLDRTTKFFVPNVFTPGVDGKNDMFEWQVAGIDEFKIVIYNRWGTKVFESEDPTAVWDGTRMNGGTEQPDGTYFYIVTGREQTIDQELVEYRGDITLIRE